MKYFLSIIVSAGLLLNIASCSHNIENNNVLICGFSDSVPEITPRLEYTEWSKNSYVDSKQPQIAKVSIGGIEYSGTYIESESNYGTYETRHSYMDNNNKIFELNDDGALTAYFWGSGNISNEIKSQEECQNIARDFISGVFGSFLNDHEERVTYDNERKMYTIEFVKFVENVETEDKATVVVETSGHIYNYRSSLWGKVREAYVPDFDLGEIEKIVSDRLDDLTKDARKTYDQVEYKDYCYHISMITESKYIILCDVNVYCMNRNGAFDNIVSEKLQFVIPLE